MRRFLQINLFLSSILALAIVSCSPASGYRYARTGIITDADIRPIVNKSNSLLYKAKIKLYNRDFSGLILLKQLSPEISHLVFITEIGMKMFDFEIQNGVFKLVYVFEPLNKPKIIQLLENDMKLILLHHLLNKEAKVYQKKEEYVFKVKEDLRYYYQLNSGSKTVKKITKKGPVFTKVKVNYFYKDSIDASQVKLKHKGLIRLKIELTNLNKPQS